MAFHDVRFPVKISFGSSGGPERKTDIVEMSTGAEERNSPWLHSRRRYNVAYGIRSMNQIHDVLAFFEARHGMLHSFRYKDWADYKSCGPDDTISPTDQVLGTGDGTEDKFQLVKRYTSGSQTYVRPITKPVNGTVVVSLDGVNQPSGWNYDLGTGIVTFDSPPGNGVVVRAGFEFDVPVRFDTDYLAINLAEWRAGQITDIPLIEVRGE